MAIMLVERLLRDENGNSLNISVPAQSKVAVLGTFPPFIRNIRVLELPNQPEGFVTIGAVDATTDLPPTAVLDKGLFARRCAEQEDLYGVSAHYLMSVAQGFKRTSRMDLVRRADPVIRDHLLSPCQSGDFFPLCPI